MKVSTKDILDIVCNYYLLTRKELFRETRKRHITQKRQVYFYLSCLYTKESLESIGRIALDYGRKAAFNYATVRHGKKTILDLLEVDRNLQEEIKVMTSMISDNQRKIPQHIEQIHKQMYEFNKRLLKLEKQPL